MKEVEINTYKHDNILLPSHLLLLLLSCYVNQLRFKISNDVPPKIFNKYNGIKQ